MSNKSHGYDERLLRRVEELAVAIDREREKGRKAANDLYEANWKLRRLEEAEEHLRQARATIERLKKKHPKLVSLPAFMRPIKDDDIPF